MKRMSDLQSRTSTREDEVFNAVIIIDRICVLKNLLLFRVLRIGKKKVGLSLIKNDLLILERRQQLKRLE